MSRRQEVKTQSGKKKEPSGTKKVKIAHSEMNKRIALMDPSSVRAILKPQLAKNTFL